MADPKSVGVSPDDNRDYLGIEYAYLPVLEFTQNREPTLSDTNFAIGSFWIVGKNPNSGFQGDRWYLAYFNDTGGAVWFKDAPAGGGGSGNLSTLSDTAGQVVSPDGLGNIQIDAGSGIQVTSDAPSNKLTVSLIGGGTAADQFSVDSATSPGVSPVVPDNDGEVTVEGAVVAAHSVPLETHARALNAFNIEAQLATTVTPTPGDNTAVGFSSYNENHFSVDGTSGMVSSTASQTAASAPADTNDAGVASFNSKYFTTTANGWVSMTGGGEKGFINLGVSLSSGVLTIHGSDGSALSSTNPAYVTLGSKTPGQLVTVAVTANQSLNDATSGAGSDMTNTLLGLQSGDDWGSTTTGINNTVIPLFIVGVLNDDEDHISFALRRIPGGVGVPAEAFLGTPSAVASSNFQDGAFFFESITKSEYAKNPALNIGVITATFDQPGGADDWVFRDASIPLGELLLPARRNFPQGVFGADSGTWLLPNGNTAPVFNSGRYSYLFTNKGEVQIYYTMTGDGGTDGSGAVNAQFACPFITDITASFDFGFARVQTPTYNVGASKTLVSNKNYLNLRRSDTGAVVQNDDFTNGARTIAGSAIYPIYAGN